MPRPRSYSDEAIIIGLRVKSVERGRKSGGALMAPMTASWWDDYRDPKNHPSSVTVTRRFGTWSKACEIAGVPTRDLGAVGRPQTWTDGEMLAVLAEFLGGKRRPSYSFAAYSDWAKLHASRPSGPSILKRFGSWGRAKGLVQP